MIPFRKIVFYTVFFVSLVFTILLVLDRFEKVMMTGELSRGHETLGNSCSSCHTPYKNSFNTCVNCHDQIVKYSLHRTKKGVRCVYCHSEHSSKVRKPDPERCLSTPCHGNFNREVRHSLDRGLCLKCHPEHLSGRERVKFPPLKFSHREHSDPSKNNSFSECIFCHPFNYDGGGVAKPLGEKQCKKCHEKIIKDHKVERVFFTDDCYICHFKKEREAEGKISDKRLRHANFRHDNHFAIACTLCHFRMLDFTTIEEIKIFSSGKKYRFCTKCHPHVPFSAQIP